MKIVYALNWFLDYRLPVFEHLKTLTVNNFYVLYNKDNVPERVHLKMKNLLGDKAIAFSNEKILTIGNRKKSGDFANKFFEIRYQPGLYSKIKELNPDVLIGEGFFRWGLVNLTYKAFNKVKYLMLYERTPHTERNVSKIVQFVRKLTFPLIDGINCNGKLCKDYILSLDYNHSKISERHMVADTLSISANSQIYDSKQREEFKNSLDLKGKVYLYCGQMVKRKGVKELIDAWVQFNTINNEEKTLLMIGSGEEEEYVKSKSKIISNIKYLDKVDFDVIYKYFCVADVFVILTLEDNGSIVLPEAMAAGLPVITSKFNGNHPEYINKKNGWVVNPINSNEVIKVFNEVFTSDLVSMGKESLKIMKDFTPEIAAKNIYNAATQSLKN